MGNGDNDDSWVRCHLVCFDVLVILTPRSHRRHLDQLYKREIKGERERERLGELTNSFTIMLYSQLTVWLNKDLKLLSIFDCGNYFVGLFQNCGM